MIGRNKTTDVFVLGEEALVELAPEATAEAAADTAAPVRSGRLAHGSRERLGQVAGSPSEVTAEAGEGRSRFPLRFGRTPWRGGDPFRLGEEPKRRGRPARSLAEDHRPDEFPAAEKRMKGARRSNAPRWLAAAVIGAGATAVVAQVVGREHVGAPSQVPATVGERPAITAQVPPVIKRDSRERLTRQRERNEPRQAPSDPAPVAPAPSIPVAASPSPTPSGGGSGGGESFGFEH